MIDLNRSQIGAPDQSTQFDMDVTATDLKSREVIDNNSDLSKEVETAIKNRDYKTMNQRLEQATSNFTLIFISQETVSHLIESSEWN